MYEFIVQFATLDDCVLDLSMPLRIPGNRLSHLPNLVLLFEILTFRDVVQFWCDKSKVTVMTKSAEYVIMFMRDSVVVRIMPAVGRAVSLRPVLVLLRPTRRQYSNSLTHVLFIILSWL